MTHRSPAHRRLVEEFVMSGGRFTRHMKFKLYFHENILQQTSNKVVPLSTSFILGLQDLPTPGNSGHLKGLSNGYAPIRVDNISDVTTVAYRTRNGFLEYAAVTWHPDNVTWHPDNIGAKDSFSRQMNNVHTIERFNTAPILVPLDQLAKLGDDYHISAKGNVVYMGVDFSNALVREYGHFAKREKITIKHSNETILTR